MSKIRGSRMTMTLEVHILGVHVSVVVLLIRAL